jgi:hypothetical protein
MIERHVASRKPPLKHYRFQNPVTPFYLRMRQSLDQVGSRPELANPQAMALGSGDELRHGLEQTRRLAAKVLLQ